MASAAALSGPLARVAGIGPRTIALSSFVINNDSSADQLKQWLRSWFARAAGGAADAQDVLITSGGQGALSAAFRAVGPAGAPLLVESPTYPGALAAARSAGLRPVPVPTDTGGVIPEHLAEAFARTGAQAFYCQPLFHNPTGAVLAADRRGEVLGAAAAAGAFVIEDDFSRWLSHGPPPPAPLLADDTEGRVVYITSLTKVASPSLRIGAVIARGPVTSRLRALRAVDDLFVAGPLQDTALDLVSRPVWQRHLKELSRALGRRAAVLSAAVARHLPAASLSASQRGRAGGRMAERTRRVGLLKAVGGTPGLVSAVLALAVLNTLFTAWATVLDSRRAAALARALGASPQQVTWGVTWAQVLPAVPGALLGIPLGFGLFAMANGGGALAMPPVWWLAAAVLAILLGVAALASIPARVGTRHPAVEVLQAETA